MSKDEYNGYLTQRNVIEKSISIERDHLDHLKHIRENTLKTKTELVEQISDLNTRVSVLQTQISALKSKKGQVEEVLADCDENIVISRALLDDYNKKLNDVALKIQSYELELAGANKAFEKLRGISLKSLLTEFYPEELIRLRWEKEGLNAKSKRPISSI